MLAGCGPRLRGVLGDVEQHQIPSFAQDDKRAVIPRPVFYRPRNLFFKRRVRAVSPKTATALRAERNCDKSDVYATQA
jgi:hypothetical protein